jgi:hypothetical protein
MRLRLAAPFIVLALTVAGCGGGQATVEEVPGGPVQLTTPGGAGLAPAATATATAGATATATATTPGASSGTTGTTTQQTASSGTSTGAANGGTQAPAATATPAPGSSAQQFEDFCAQNPGAC